MPTINDRISQVVKASGKTKTAFADSLGVSQQYISKLEKTGTPSERTIRDICDKYSVNEEWLRTGNGEMFRAKTRSDEMAEYAAKLVGGELDPFQTSLVATLAKLTPEQIDLLAGIAETMLKEYQKEKADQ